jgi:cyanophycin synthetase
VKPRDGNHGRGVSIRLEAQDAVEAAFRFAATEGSGVVVERFVAGTQYRVLVVGQRAIAAAGSEADQVIGDGVSTVAELVAAANLDPLRGEDSAKPLTTLVLDDISLELLRRQGLASDVIPAAGRNVIIHYNGDLTLDVTDRMHPEVASQCALAARAIGLDIAGIDLISESISLPLEQIGGAVIEVNASPALGVHLKPLIGTPRPVGEAIIEHMFGSGAAPLMPVVAVSGLREGTRVCRALARLVAAQGGSTAVADSRGLSIGSRELTKEDSANARGQTRALMNPFVQLAVLEVRPENVLREGLVFDRSAVVVVTQATEMVQVSAERPDTATWSSAPTEVQAAIRLPLDGLDAAGTAVLNADDPNVLAFAGSFSGLVAYYTTAASHPLVEAHFHGGGTACVCVGSTLWLWRDGEKSRIGAAVPAASSDACDLARSNLAAAVAAAAVLGINITNLVAGFEAAAVEVG